MKPTVLNMVFGEPQLHYKYLCIIFILLHIVFRIAGFIMHVESNTNIVMVTYICT